MRSPTRKPKTISLVIWVAVLSSLHATSDPKEEHADSHFGVAVLSPEYSGHATSDVLEEDSDDSRSVAVLSILHATSDAFNFCHRINHCVAVLSPEYSGHATSDCQLETYH